jgi:hypothetical protein
MSALSIFPPEGGPAFGCANPIYLTSELSLRTGDKITFEVLDADASQLKALVGKMELFALDSKVFWGTLVSLDPCESTVSSLALMRYRPAMCGVFEVHSPPSPGQQQA